MTNAMPPRAKIIIYGAFASPSETSVRRRVIIFRLGKGERYITITVKRCTKREMLVFAEPTDHNPGAGGGEGETTETVSASLPPPRKLKKLFSKPLCPTPPRANEC